MIVYLAGGITGMPIVDVLDWRTIATETLHSLGFEVRNPARESIELLSSVSVSLDFNDYKDKGVFFTSRAIMARDFNDVKNSNCLLVNLLGATRASLGTVMELGWAYAFQIPAVVCIEESGNPHDHHPMLHEAMPFRVTTLGEGILAVKHILAR